VAASARSRAHGKHLPKPAAASACLSLAGAVGARARRRGCAGLHARLTLAELLIGPGLKRGIGARRSSLGRRGRPALVVGGSISRRMRIWHRLHREAQRLPAGTRHAALTARRRGDGRADISRLVSVRHTRFPKLPAVATFCTTGAEMANVVGQRVIRHPRRASYISRRSLMRSVDPEIIPDFSHS
jgi:hypothetical protein